MPQGERQEPLNGSLVKAITILNCFSYERPRLRLKEISTLTGINQATAYRMLLTMREYNLIEHHEEYYSLGRGFLKYEGIVLKSLEIRRVGIPFLEDLSNKLQVNVNLAVLEENEVVYVARAETSFCLYGYFHIGMRRPINCTALGKVLTCKSPQVIHRVFQNGVKRYTLNTITEEDKFLQEIEHVRLQGYATDFEEWSNGINCVAAPVEDATGDIVAGISISGPTSIYPREKILEYIPTLIEYAHRLSARLGANKGW